MEAKNCRPNSLVPPDGSPSDPQPVPPASSIKTFVQTYECSTDLESNFHLSAFGQDAYIFKVHSIPIKLPEDYSAALNSLCEIASAKLINVEAGDSDTVSKKVGTLGSNPIGTRNIFSLGPPLLSKGTFNCLSLALKSKSYDCLCN